MAVQNDVDRERILDTGRAKRILKILFQKDLEHLGTILKRKFNKLLV